MAYFKREWEEFRDKVLPKNAGVTQTIEMRKAFYSGALALISIQFKGFSDGKEVTEEDVEMYDSIVNEIVETCKEFFTSLADHEPN